MSVNKAHSISQQLIFLTITVSFLDLPDLAALAQASLSLAGLAWDPLMHRKRLQIVAPSRVHHLLFGTNASGLALRPTVGDLVQRGVIRGLGIERRWRAGSYFYSRNVGGHLFSNLFD